MADELLNIRPDASILGVFSRLNYKPWYAIAEFVDNSTASFFANEHIMKFYKIKNITVTVEYNPIKKQLIIKDDAYGMELDDFKRAIKLDSKPENQSGRNEFGMGLKTAASWFGNIWSVESTQLNSKNRYYSIVDINKLKADKLNDVVIEKTTVPANTHGTTIIINEVTKPIDAPRTQSKIKSLLESMYRRDIKSGKVNIYFNGELLKFTPYDVLTFRNREWLKPLDFVIEFNGQYYNITGFVGILGEKSSGFTRAGFALFRRDRVIIGGDDENYKPNEIFGQAQSTISHKLFGEINLDDFPVNQAKDGFVWDTGLESEFIDKLRKEIEDFIEIAKLTVKQRISEEAVSEKSGKETKEEVDKSLTNLDSLFDEDEEYGDEYDVNDDNEIDDDTSNIVQVFEKEITAHKEVEVHEESARSYDVPIDKFKTENVTVKWSTGSGDYWFQYNDEEKSIVINIDHPFFKPYSNEKEFKIVLEKFVIAFILAENLAKKEEHNGYIKPSSIRNNMNKILAKLM